MFAQPQYGGVAPGQLASAQTNGSDDYELAKTITQIVMALKEMK